MKQVFGTKVCIYVLECTIFPFVSSAFLEHSCLFVAIQNLVPWDFQRTSVILIYEHKANNIDD